MKIVFPACFLIGIMALAFPSAASGLGVDVEIKGGAGIGLGTTDNKDISGAVRLSGGAGIDADIYFLEAGPVNLGICVGLDYAYLSFHSKWKNYLSYPTSQTTESKYNYINFPVMIVGSLPINSTMKLFVKAGGFVGYFVGGTAELSYDPQIPPYFTDTDVDLDSDSTNRWEWGLNFVAGVDIPIGGNFSVTPQLLFNMGLTDTTKSFAGTSFKDTFWALLPMVGIKYKLL